MANDPSLFQVVHLLEVLSACHLEATQVGPFVEVRWLKSDGEEYRARIPRSLAFEPSPVVKVPKSKRPRSRSSYCAEQAIRVVEERKRWMTKDEILVAFQEDGIDDIGDSTLEHELAELAKEGHRLKHIRSHGYGLSSWPDPHQRPS